MMCGGRRSQPERRAEEARKLTERRESPFGAICGQRFVCSKKSGAAQVARMKLVCELAEIWDKSDRTEGGQRRRAFEERGWTPMARLLRALLEWAEPGIRFRRRYHGYVTTPRHLPRCSPRCPACWHNLDTRTTLGGELGESATASRAGGRQDVPHPPEDAPARARNYVALPSPWEPPDTRCALSRTPATRPWGGEYEGNAIPPSMLPQVPGLDEAHID